MADPAIDLSLIVPVRDGAERLPKALCDLRAYIAEAPAVRELILIDDGSGAPTRQLLATFAAGTRGVTLLRNDVNTGKGHAVARGMLVARGRHRVFTDADLAYPVDQIAAITAALTAGSDVAVACRVLPASRYLMSPSFFHYLYTRHLMSRAFNAVVRWTLLPGILDSQAGLKGFTARAAEGVFSRLTIDRFGFDVEALLIARRLGLRTTQVPVFFRYDSEPSTVRLVGDGGGMVGDLLRIRWNDLRGRYR
ncbi:MAG TPA: glycosyltransferase [Gemmatimonadales bacterium]